MSRVLHYMTHIDLLIYCVITFQFCIQFHIDTLSIWFWTLKPVFTSKAHYLTFLCCLLIGIISNFLSFTFFADSSLGNGYCLPPQEIRDIVDAPPHPKLSFSPHRDKLLFRKRRSLPPLADLAKPEDKLAGIRIDGKSNSRSRMWVRYIYVYIVSFQILFWIFKIITIYVLYPFSCLYLDLFGF